MIFRVITYAKLIISKDKSMSYPDSSMIRIVGCNEEGCGSNTSRFNCERLPESNHVNNHGRAQRKPHYLQQRTVTLLCAVMILNEVL